MIHLSYSMSLREVPSFECDVCGDPIEANDGVVLYSESDSCWAAPRERLTPVHVHMGKCFGTAEERVYGKVGGYCESLAKYLAGLAISADVPADELVEELDRRQSMRGDEQPSH